MNFLKLKLAEIYRKIGLFERALKQYHRIYCKYRDMGLENMALDIFKRMTRVAPNKFTLKEDKHHIGPEYLKRDLKKDINLHSPKDEEEAHFCDLSKLLEAELPNDLIESNLIRIEGGIDFKKIYEELKKIKNRDKLYPNYNFQMGKVCLKMGLIEEAIHHFQKAVINGEKVNEASKYLIRCVEQNKRVGVANLSEKRLQKKKAIDSNGV